MLGILPSYTSFWPANEGLRRPDGTRRGRSPSDGDGRRRRAGKTFHPSRRQRERPWKNMLRQKRSEEQLPHDHGQSKHSSPVPSFFYRHYYPGKRAETAIRGRYLGPADLIGPHGQSRWWVRFGGRAYLCATEHLRHARRSGLLGPR